MKLLKENIGKCLKILAQEVVFWYVPKYRHQKIVCCVYVKLAKLLNEKEAINRVKRRINTIKTAYANYVAEEVIPTMYKEF